MTAEPMLQRRVRSEPTSSSGPAFRQLLTSLLCALGFLLFTSPADAFCRSRTCLPLKEHCEMDGYCVASGKLFNRTSSCVSYSVQQDGSAKHGITSDALEKVVAASFERWLAVDCGGGARPSIEVQNIGQVSCEATQYNCDGHGNANIVLFRDDSWPYTDEESVFALTTTYFATATGRIDDVDVEINGTNERIRNGEPLDGVDLASIITHELGHFLGLSHSGDPTAVMRRTYRPGMDNLRNLRPDDVAGICDMYPPGRATKTDSCAPKYGFATDCGTNDHDFCPIEASEESSGCCSTAPGRPDSRGALALGALCVGLAAVRLRRVRRRSRAPEL